MTYGFCRPSGGHQAVDLIASAEEPLLLFLPVKGGTARVQLRTGGIGITVKRRIKAVQRDAAAAGIDGEKIGNRSHHAEVADLYGAGKGDAGS